MNKAAPIGVFDSGYGGLTILDEIRKTLPEYDYIYLGDNSRAPYGSRSFEVVYEYTLEAVKKLFSMGCNLVILACNTASAKALRTIQQNDLAKIDPKKRVLGIIRPTAEIVGNLSKTNHIGILGTQGTVLSHSYDLEIKKLHPNIVVNSHACPMWVPIVENNEFSKDGADFYIEQDIKTILKTDPFIDTLILACTHYPLLLDKIKKYVPSNVEIVTQGKYVSDSLKDYLKRHLEIDAVCSKNGNINFYTTENSEKFRKSASLFLKEEIEKATKINFD